jgi:O-antigen/teichoic acid export membrane protein
MSLLKKNVIANFASKVVTALAGFIVVPFYQKFLGLEAYGLISFFVTLQAVIAIFDLGLSLSSNREMGALSAAGAGGEKGPGRRLLRTMECFYFLVGAGLFLFFALTADFWAFHWIQSNAIPREAVRACVVLAGGAIGLRWPISLYSGILMGLERQVLANGLSIVLTLLKTVGSIGVIMFVSASPVFFYQWQVVAGLMDTAVMGVAAWRVLGGIRPWRTRFDPGIFKTVWRFGLSVGAISIFAMLLKQLDKLVISKMLPIEHLGYYNTAWLAAAGISMLFQPVQAAVFPRFNKLWTRGDRDELQRTFHRASQVVAFTAAPAAGVLVFFSHELLSLWTQSDIVAAQAGLPLTLLGLAALFNGMMAVPFALQLAAGMTWLPMANNGIALVVMGPVIYALVIQFGIAGGGVAWLLYNILYYAILPQFMFRHVLRSRKKTWYFRDTLPFMGLGLGLAAGVRLWCNGLESIYFQAAVAAVGAGVYAAAGIGFSRTLQSMIGGRLGGRRLSGVPGFRI